MKNLFLILAFLISGIGYAQTKNNSESNLDGLCAVVSSLREESAESEHEYVYQTKILSAAGVSNEDSEETIRKKVQTFWKQNEAKLICDSPDFNVPNGSIVKFAVARRFEAFIDDVTESWGVDLNKIDSSDNRTVLDYVKSEIEKHKETPIESILKRYYRKLRAAGAKHKSEL
ncbi:hypothetical protein SAMN05421741_11623 [Paenimyroides ummariense]|uniref:DUF4468 domain-containing protein n=1 Tax=Paenimyroides ummariense TaxID=913024 RepID=A0A1I5DJJ9_9FLAO|nr:hypothetical protein [Paenimyroides ummariense]SFN99368.1 hypothetical protein SAMN05421741_11623 [Paenimyroides ummariense]